MEFNIESGENGEIEVRLKFIVIRWSDVATLMERIEQEDILLLEK